MISLVLSSNDHVGVCPYRGFGKVEVLRHHLGGLRKVGGVSRGIVHCDSEPHQMAQRAECLSYAAVTNNQQFRTGQDWFDKNLHLSPARHTDSQLLIPQVEGNDLWLGRRHALQCFGLDRAFGASTAYPSDDQFALLVDQAFGTSRS